MTTQIDEIISTAESRRTRSPDGVNRRNETGSTHYLGRLNSGLGDLQPSDNREFEKGYSLKEAVITLMDSWGVTTLTEAARRLKVSPLSLYKLKEEDPEWGLRLKGARQVLADRLETELLEVKTMAAVIARLALLKTIRPIFRDSYKLTVDSTKLESYLKELKEADKIRKDIKIKVPPVQMLESSEDVD